jgi:phytoene dehydrogenase-like protein
VAVNKSVIIVGAGLGGLAAGIYGQLNGYDTTIFEQHTLPGGQCATWKRKGFSFDGCIHHLFGCEPGSKFYALWEELGAMPRELVRTRECVSAASPDGELFIDYYDPELLERHLKELAPGDSAVIEKYASAIPLFAGNDFLAEAMVGSPWKLAAMAPGMLRLAGWLKPTMEQFAGRFSDPFIRRAFPLLEYGFPDSPLVLHMVKHAYGYTGGIAWPVGGSVEFARSIERRYTGLGGEVHYRQPVEKILTANGRALGVKLADGSELRADLVISNADGRKTIMGLLEGRYTDEKIRRWCEPPDDVTNWAVHVFLGVARDLSGEPSALVQLLDRPLTVADHTADSIEMQMYGVDPTMAPEGKGVIKVELFSSYSYWKKLYADRVRYDEEKQKVAQTVIDVLDRTRFGGIRSQVEVVDVPTLMTWERYVGGTHGFQSAPKKKFSVMSMLTGGLASTLPGLSDFYLVGTWATSAGALFSNALSGRKVIEAICKRDDKPFTSR